MYLLSLIINSHLWRTFDWFLILFLLPATGDDYCLLIYDENIMLFVPDLLWKTSYWEFNLSE